MSTLRIVGDQPGACVEMGWDAVRAWATRMASALHRRGLGPGSRIGVLGDTSAAVVAAIQAVWMSGSAITMLPPPWHRTWALSAIAADAGLDAILTETDPGPIGDLPQVILLRDLNDGPVARFTEPRPEDLAILQYTSGSTGVPRGVPVTHAHLQANLTAIVDAFDVGDEVQRLMSWLPLYHDMGLIGFLALPMARRYPLVLQSPRSFALNPASWFRHIAEFGITTSAAPNFAYGLMTQLLESGLDCDLRGLRFLLSGGEPIDAAAMTRFASAASGSGLDPGTVIPAYGLAEATLAVTISPPGHGIRSHRSEIDGVERVRLGRAVTGSRIEIAENGEIVVTGPSVVGHYWGEPAPPPGSRLHTGDLGYLVDGELVVYGRRKDVFFCGGRNVYPQDVETIAAQVFGVRRAAAFGVPGKHGDRLVVVVESRAADETALRRAVTATVRAGAGMSPAEVVVVKPGRLPCTSSGKLRRAELKHRYLNGRGTVQ